MSNPEPRRPSLKARREEGEAIKRELDAKLSPEERELMKEAGKKLRFWTNVGVAVGFMSFSLPITMRSGIRYRFIKGMVAGTIGVFACAPLGMLYGGKRANDLILTHPNHEHLLKVLRETRNELLANRRIDSHKSSDVSPDGDSSDSWSSERQETYPSTPNSSSDSFDEDTLLTDEEISRRNQGATFTPPNQPPSEASPDGSQSAWDVLRARAAQQQKPTPEEKKNIWGENK